MRKYRAATLVAFLLLGLAGTAAGQRDRDNDRRDRNRNVNQPQEDRWVRGEVGPQWDLMTKQAVNFRDDRDRIEVGDAGHHAG